MFPVLDVMAAACAAHRVNGFVKKADVYQRHADKVPNSRLLYQHFYGEQKLDMSPADYEQAEHVIEYLTGLTFKAFERELTDFEQNTLKLVTSEEIDSSSLGIAASLPKVYLNKLDQDRWEIRERELTESSEYVGELHKRCNFDLVVENIRYIKTTGSNLYCCSVDGKHVVKFFGEGYGNVGDIIHVAGFVKSQQISKYSGGKETMINRIKDLTVND